MARGIEAMSSVDTAWLRMDDPANLMVIGGMLTLASHVPVEEYRNLMVSRMLTFDRFRKRAVITRMPFCPAYWEFDPDFDINWHVVDHQLEAPGEQPQLEAICGELMSQPLDNARPLWRVHLIQGYQGRTAVVLRIHHCLVDGVAMNYVLSVVGRPEPHVPEACEPAPLDALSSGGRFQIFRHKLGDSLKGLWNGIARKDGRHITAATAAMARMTKDPETRLKGELGIPKVTTWSAKPIPVADVKAVGRALGATVNDVLVASLSGSFRRYLADKGDPVDDISFRAAIPVDLKSLSERRELGNKFGVVFLELPINLPTPEARLAAVHERMLKHKDSAEAEAILGVLNTVGVMPNTVQKTVIGSFSSKATAVMTNVIGSQKPFYLASGMVDGIMVWVPQTGRLSIGISIFSYAGNVWVGIMSDKGILPDPQAIVGGMLDEFSVMQGLAESV